jgi:glyoxylase-like metal-dependent hydrolase (beta-lactamase superfamily II)
MPDWIESLRRVEALDFDVLVPGHGALGTRANVTMFREYLQDLRAEVVRYAREGKSADEMKQLIKLPKYDGWGPRDWFPLNIEGMHRLVQATRRPN